jgi:hypothetical protein
MATEKKNSGVMLKAVIGLVGTVLTVCGGLTTATIGAAVTIYQVERGRDQVNLVPSESDSPLIVDTQRIAVDRREAVQLDPDEYNVISDLDFALAQPRAGWGQLEEMTYYDLFMGEREEAVSPLVLFSMRVGSTWDEQPVRRMRYAEPILVQFQEETGENGVPVDLDLMRDLKGTDTLSYYSQIMVLAIDKEVAADYTLAGIALAWGPIPQYGGGLNRVVASEESDYIFMQATTRLEKVRLDGQETDLAMERWALFAEGPQYYYLLEIDYVPEGSQSTQVQEDLQAYLASFRVIR